MPETRRDLARRWTAALSVAFAVGGGGTFFAPPLLAQDDDAPPPAPVAEADSAPVDVPLPPGLSPDLLPPAVGSEAARRLHVPLIEALADVQPAVFEDEEGERPSAELPEHAADALDRAQRLIDEGRSFEAGAALREAERLAPDHPRVVRALGLSYVCGGNPVRGLPHLRRAAALDPADVDVRVVLTRLALDRQAWDETLALAAAIDSANTQGQHPDPAAEVFAHYTRAVTLDQLGYAEASAELYRAVLASAAPESADTVAGREQFILHERAGALRQRIGDLLLRLEEPAAALAAYETAATARVEDPGGLAARLSYLYLRAGRHDAAAAAVVGHIVSSAATEDDAALADYLVTQGIDPDALDARLDAAAAQAPAGHFPLVAARARLLPQARTVELIDEWLAAQPPRIASFRRAIALARAPDGGADDPAALAQVFLLTAREMVRHPAAVEDYSRAFLELESDPVALLRAIRRPEVAQADQPMALRLTADAYTSVGRLHDASVALGQVLAIDPDQTPTRRAQVRLLLALSVYDSATLGQARALLGEVGTDAAMEDFLLSVDLLRYEAFAIDDDERRRARLLRDAQRRVAIRLRAEPDDLDLMLLDARVRAESRGLVDGIRAIDAVLARFPREERVYTAAIGLYRTIRRDERRDLNLQLYFQFQQRLRLQLVAELPESRTARHEHASALYFDERRPDLALPIFEALVAEDPEDPAALGMLQYVCEQTGDTARADELELRGLELEPQSVWRSVELMRYYVRRGDKQRAQEVYEHTLGLEAEGVMPGPALTGDAAGSLLLQLSFAVGDAASEPQFLEMLRRFPDNATLNNGLGYRWAMAGKELLAAEAMVQRAIDARGEVSSYLDSKAWVLYKMGRFAEAEAVMRQAIEAMVQELQEAGRDDEGAAKALYFDHLGDILYRLGDAQAAAGCWDIARIQTIDTEPALLDPETATVLERAAAKAQAARAGLEPDVSEVPGEPAFGDGVHPADRG